MFNLHFFIYFILVRYRLDLNNVFIFKCFLSACQPGFLLAAEQKGFEFLELRGEDPRLASLDTLSGEEIPLHLLLRLHGYIIQVGGATTC